MKISSVGPKYNPNFGKILIHGNRITQEQKDEIINDPRYKAIAEKYPHIDCVIYYEQNKSIWETTESQCFSYMSGHNPKDINLSKARRTKFQKRKGHSIVNISSAPTVWNEKSDIFGEKYLYEVERGYKLHSDIRETVQKKARQYPNADYDGLVKNNSLFKIQEVGDGEEERPYFTYYWI